MKILIFTTLVTLSTYSYAFESGDKIKCTDSVSSHTYLIKIVDIGDEEAYIKVETNLGNYFYPSSRVIFDEKMELNSTITRSILPNSGGKSGGEVNFTKSKKAQNDAILSLVYTATEKFKKEIIDAF